MVNTLFKTALAVTAFSIASQAQPNIMERKNCTLDSIVNELNIRAGQVGEDNPAVCNEGGMIEFTLGNPG